MNQLAALTLAAGMAGAFAANSAGTAGAEEPAPQTLLKNAILCQGNPLEIIRKLAASGSSNYAQGIRCRSLGVADLKLKVVGFAVAPGPPVPSHNHDGHHLLVAVSDLDLRSDVEGIASGPRKVVSLLTTSPLLRASKVRSCGEWDEQN